MLRTRLVGIGCRMLVEHLVDGRAGLPVPRDQVGNPSYADKILSHELELDWDLPALQLRRVVRLGRAWTTFRGKRLRVLAAGHADSGGTIPELEPGRLDGAEVGAGDGTRLLLRTVQPEGKRPMDALDWLRGVPPRPDDRLGS